MVQLVVITGTPYIGNFMMPKCGGSAGSRQTAHICSAFYAFVVENMLPTSERNVVVVGGVVSSSGPLNPYPLVQGHPPPDHREGSRAVRVKGALGAVGEPPGLVLLFVPPRLVLLFV